MGDRNHKNGHIGFSICDLRLGKTEGVLIHTQTIRLPYKEWAENHIARIKGVLDGARAEHTQAVKDRIDAVDQMKDVVSLTEGLFAISKVRAPPNPVVISSSHILCGFLPTGDCAT